MSCILHVACRACCMLHVAFCILHVACCMSHVACRMPHVACFIFAVACRMPTSGVACRTLHVVQITCCMMHVVSCFMFHVACRMSHAACRMFDCKHDCTSHQKHEIAQNRLHAACCTLHVAYSGCAFFKTTARGLDCTRVPCFGPGFFYSRYGRLSGWHAKRRIFRIRSMHGPNQADSEAEAGPKMARWCPLTQGHPRMFAHVPHANYS